MPVSTSDGGGGYGAPLVVENTLDEPIWETIKRDLRRIWKNLVSCGAGSSGGSNSSSGRLHGRSLRTVCERRQADTPAPLRDLSRTHTHAPPR